MDEDVDGVLRAMREFGGVVGLVEVFDEEVFINVLMRRFLSTPRQLSASGNGAAIRLNAIIHPLSQLVLFIGPRRSAVSEQHF